MQKRAIKQGYHYNTPSDSESYEEHDSETPY